MRFAAAGHAVAIGSRDAARAGDVVAEVLAGYPDRTLTIRGCANQEAAAAELVVLAMPWDASAPTAGALAEQLADKVVICMSNALARVGKEFYALYPPRGSIAADVQATIPRSGVVAAFQHLPARELADLDQTMVGDVLVCTDHPEALDQTMALIAEIPNLRALDCGSLGNATPIEAFTAVLLQLNRRYQTHTSLSISGI